MRGDLESGSVVGGYRIDELISRGGMGVVYRATNVALNRIYALKVLAPELTEDVQFRERFKRETRIAASLHHPNIVGIHYAGEHEGMLFFVMDFVTGTDLHQLLAKCGALDPNRAVCLLEQAASALDAAHSGGLVHRDVKPGNILITVKEGEEHAYLTDFGLAKKSDTASALTAKGLVVGTVDYMAPEQITGSAIDARTDIYALGCVFYQMLSGRVPYERENSVATLFAHAHDPPPRLEGSITEQYPAFAPVIEKAMAKDPAERYFSAGDFARDAVAVLEGMRFTGPPTIVATGEARLTGTMAVPPVTAQSPPEAPEPEAPSEPRPAPAPETKISEPAAQEPQPPAQPQQPAEPQQWPPPEPEQTPPPQAPADLPAAAAAATAASSPEPQWAAAGPPATAAPGPPASPPGAGPPPVANDSHDNGGGGSSPKRFLFPALAVLVIAGAIVAVVALSSGGGSSKKTATTPKPTGTPFKAAAQPVPTNRVTGHGNATVFLHGNQVTVTVDTNGLLNGSPHAMHIHAGGLGVCPPARAAKLHNGHRSISTTDGIHWYGPPEVALTSKGDTSRKSIIDFSRFPTTGNIRYTRSFTIPAGIAGAIRSHDAVIIVHGIDYDHNRIYDDVLDRSELKHSLPGEATAPALCGKLVGGTQTADAGGSGGTTTYAAVLHRSVAAAVPAPSGGFSWICHLPGANTSPVADPRSVGGTTV